MRRCVDVENVRFEDVEVGDVVGLSETNTTPYDWSEVTEVRQPPQYSVSRDVVIYTDGSEWPEIGDRYKLIPVQVVRASGSNV